MLRAKEERQRFAKLVKKRMSLLKRAHKNQKNMLTLQKQNSKIKKL